MTSPTTLEQPRTNRAAADAPPLPPPPQQRNFPPVPALPAHTTTTISAVPMATREATQPTPRAARSAPAPALRQCNTAAVAIVSMVMALAILHLLGAITWPWWVVLTPIWAPPLAVMLLWSKVRIRY